MSNLPDILEALEERLRPPTIKQITVEDVMDASAAYSAGDVVTANETDTTGYPWEFKNVARINGGSGYITNLHIVAETTNIASQFTLLLYTSFPTCELDDQAPNTGPLIADRHIYVGKIDCPAASDVGSGASDTTATPSTVGSLPMAFVCNPSSRSLWGVLTIRNALDLSAATILQITLTAEQY